MSPNYEPPGVHLVYATGLEIILVDSGPYEGWICFRHADGGWVTLRKATPLDILVIELAKNGLEYPPVPATPRAEEPQP